MAEVRPPSDLAERSTGTTIIAVQYDGGVVMGADGRVTTGTYISNRASSKVTPLSDNVFLLRSGSAPDTQAIADYVRYFAHQLHAETGKEINVLAVANLVKTLNYQNKQLMGALIVGGYDEQEGGQVYGLPIGGTLVREQWTVDGSGSTFLWGFCDHEYRENFTREEAETFVIEALALAMASDSSSGGPLRLVTMNKDGVFHRYVRGDQVPLYGDTLAPPGHAGMVVG